MAARVVRRNVGNSLRYDVPTGYMTTAQFCKKVGISDTTLKILRRKGYVTPDAMEAGQLMVNLYSERNVREVELYRSGYYRLMKTAEAVRAG